MPDDAYRTYKRAGVVEALARNGLADAAVADLVEIGPATRRRGAFKAAKESGIARVGFHAAASHEIVDMLECRVLTPQLFALVSGLRSLATQLLGDGEKLEMTVTETENGADVAIASKRKMNVAARAVLAQWAVRLKLARVTLDDEPIVALTSPDVVFGKARVVLPPGAFLQATRGGEAELQSRVGAALAGAKAVADLFAGCGTFALVLAEKARVHAVDGDGLALDALAAAARHAQGLKPVSIEKRDLLKRPLAAAELLRFDAVALDPPRVGAAAQVKELVKSKVARIAYVSCNPSSFGRDARILVEAGYRLGTVTPVDQFLWSSHIELFAAFTRG